MCCVNHNDQDGMKSFELHHEDVCIDVGHWTFRCLTVNVNFCGTGKNLY